MVDDAGLAANCPAATVQLPAPCSAAAHLQHKSRSTAASPRAQRDSSLLGASARGDRPVAAVSHSSLLRAGADSAASSAIAGTARDVSGAASAAAGSVSGVAGGEGSRFGHQLVRASRGEAASVLSDLTNVVRGGEAWEGQREQQVCVSVCLSRGC